MLLLHPSPSSLPTRIYSTLPPIPVRDRPGWTRADALHVYTSLLGMLLPHLWLGDGGKGKGESKGKGKGKGKGEGKGKDKDKGKGKSKGKGKRNGKEKDGGKGGWEGEMEKSSRSVRGWWMHWLRLERGRGEGVVVRRAGEGELAGQVDDGDGGSRLNVGRYLEGLVG